MFKSFFDFSIPHYRGEPRLIIFRSARRKTKLYLIRYNIIHSCSRLYDFILSIDRQKRSLRIQDRFVNLKIRAKNKI